MKTKLIYLCMFWVQLSFSQTVSLPALQTINYKYHIRGGLLGINLDATNNPVPNYSEGDLFSYKLVYEKAGQWAGNIGKQTWARATDLTLPCNIDTRSYTFGYDLADRLKSATYSGTGNYSIPSISYDKNSNITGLQRNGWLGSSYGGIDNLSYTYSGNQLTTVTDAIGGNHTIDLVPKLNGARTYYEDGSLKSDENKEITLIEYDPSLMLPIKITLTAGRTVTMGYALDGTLEKRTYSTGEEWIYSNGMTFLNGQPYSMPIPEGRAMYSAGAWKNEFFITDHLGNVRVTFEKNSIGKLAEISVADFDPTGVEHEHTNLIQSGFKLDPFKFQDKEQLSSTFGLNGINDFGPRMLDKTIGGIWSQPDILAEMNEGASPFSYLNGRLLNMTDPTGMESRPSEDQTSIEADRNGPSGMAGITVSDYGGPGEPTGNPNKPNTNPRKGSAMVGGAKSFYQKTVDFSIDINEYNPIANVVNGISGMLYGEDINGRKMDGFSPAMSILAAVPIMKITKVVGPATNVANQGFKTFEAFKRTNGVAGKGYAWHHIVEKHAANLEKFGAEKLHNLKNLIRVPEGSGSLHRKVTGFYNSYLPNTKIRVRDYVKSLNFEEQYKFGVEQLKKLGF
jgi:hypothetical protein